MEQISGKSLWQVNERVLDEDGYLQITYSKSGNMSGQGRSRTKFGMLRGSPIYSVY